MGRITRGGHRVFFFYTRRATSAWGEFLERLVHKSGYALALSARSDRRHAGYRKELYPTADDWQVISTAPHRSLGVFQGREVRQAIREVGAARPAQA